LLAPLALIYGASSLLHRKFGFQTRISGQGLLPLMVVGGLRAGGSGKTALTLELARCFSPGLRLGVLAYWLHQDSRSRDGNKGLNRLAPDLAEVGPDADWRHCSDEAVLLARHGGARVFVTRNREKAWELLSRTGELDALLSDDGLMDPRLDRAFRLALRAPEENPGPLDLLPAGPYRLTAAMLGQADCVAEGPNPESCDPQGYWFQRRLELPQDLDPEKAWWAVCGLGNPQRFCRDLQDLGLRLAGRLSGPDHGLPAPRLLQRARKRRPEAGFLCTAKDAVKLEGADGFGPLCVVGEKISISPA
jgi:tetraacyldisaccharide 4'-kinase